MNRQNVDWSAIWRDRALRWRFMALGELVVIALLLIFILIIAKG